MRVSTAIAIYFLIWWIALFAVLPFGIRSQHEDNAYAPGTDPGAPIMARIGMKLLWTTLVATVIFGVAAAIYIYGLIDFDALMAWLRPAR